MAEDLRLILRNELIRLEARERWTVICEHGEVWITQRGHAEDIVLQAHQRTEIAAGDVLIEGVGELRVRPRPSLLYRAGSRLLLALWHAVRRRRRRRVQDLCVSTLHKS